MKLKIENQKLQDKEVENWWNDEKTNNENSFTHTTWISFQPPPTFYLSY